MAQTKREFRLNGWHVLGMLVAFFGVIFAVNGAFVYFAETSWTGLVPGNGYEASLKYNREAAKARALLAKGWRAKVLVPKNGRIVIELATREGEPVSGLKARAQILRAIGIKGDRKATFSEREPGRYVIDQPLPPGSWRMDARFTRSGELQWRVSAEFVVPER